MFNCPPHRYKQPKIGHAHLHCPLCGLLQSIPLTDDERAGVMTALDYHGGMDARIRWMTAYHEVIEHLKQTGEYNETNRL